VDYTVVKSTIDGWDVEAFTELEGAFHGARFWGVDSEKRAREYAEWKRGGQMHTQPEPTPTPGAVSVTRAVMADLEEREKHGTAKYGTTLQTFNGRSALVDLYQELIDATQYCKQLLMEQERGAGAELKLAVEALEKITHTACYDPGEGGCIGQNKCPRCTAKETLFDIRKLP
jgi:hypothetical protein